MTSQLLCPFDLHVDRIARFCNAELDDPTYDGIEVQWFDDDLHGRGLLVFLQRRATALVDYYVTPGLTLDRDTYVLGAGTGAWTETSFATGHLDISPAGIQAEVAFTDVDGRSIEVAIDDQRSGTRSTGRMLAPVGSTIEQPASLLLVYLHGFDLVRAGDPPPRITIDGRRAATGRLPGQAFHGRELIKYAAPLEVITVNRNQDGPLGTVTEGPGAWLEFGAISALEAGDPDQPASLRFRPAFPDLSTVPDKHRRNGRWRVYCGDAPPLCGGTWRLERTGDQIAIDLEVVEGWRPGPLPPLMRAVTSVIPVFRRWPTTYRWSATVTLGDEPWIRSGWTRTAAADTSYTRATSRG